MSLGQTRMRMRSSSSTADRGQRAQMLADGQRGNADKADEVRQTLLPSIQFNGLRCGAPLASSATIAGAMNILSRRDFLMTASAATLAAAAAPGIAATRQRVFVASFTPDGILAYDWDPVAGELKVAGVAAKVPNVDWLALSHGREFVYAALELDMFNGKPTGEVASFRVWPTASCIRYRRRTRPAWALATWPSTTPAHAHLRRLHGRQRGQLRIDHGRLSEPCGPSATPITDPIPTGRPPRTLTLLLSHLTTALPISTTWAATVSTSTSQTRPRRP
jgi:hypothetical protein